MFILPLEFAYKTSARAWLTFVLVALMLLIHWRVEVNVDKVHNAIGDYCDSDRGIEFSKALQRQTRDPDGDANPQWRCYTVLQFASHTGGEPAGYDYLLDNGDIDYLDEDERADLRERLIAETHTARVYVPRLLQEKLAQPAQSWNPMRMLSSTFAHGDWWHVIFNMVFLIAFGCILEVVVGPIVYLGFIFAAALTTGLAYAAVTTATGDDFSSSLGFSGADFALLGALLYLMPFAPIKSIVFIGIIPIPMRLGVWVFGLVFLGGELWFLFNHGAFDEGSGVNVLAHAVGGVTGFGLAAYFLRPLKQQLSDLLDRAHLQNWSQR
jgi:membrane associated rhomboid family serine protease